MKLSDRIWLLRNPYKFKVGDVVMFNRLIYDSTAGKKVDNAINTASNKTGFVVVGRSIDKHHNKTYTVFVNKETGNMYLVHESTLTKFVPNQPMPARKPIPYPKRVVREFLWLPKTLNGKTKWLVSADIEQWDTPGEDWKDFYFV